jgi:nucleoside-diphosphate-sugar epimerase
MAFIDKKKPVLVTGATGYIASWIIKYLIDEGYSVHGTVRNLNNKDKIAHLKDIGKKRKGKLQLFESDLLKPGSFDKAMQDCELVIHTASPFFVQGIKDAENQLIKPALEGTINVLESVNTRESVKRVVLTSSVAAIYGDASDIKETQNEIFTEDDWNTSSTIKHQPYSYSKTLAEKEAWKIVKKQKRWDLLTINPGFVMGPSLSKRVDSTSIDFIRSMVNGKFSSGVPDLYFSIVDVRDVARAHINAGIRENASGRHILVEDVKSTLEMATILKEKFHNKYKIPSRKLPNIMLYLVGPFAGFKWKYLRENLGIPYKFNNNYSKEDLGLEYRPIPQTLTEHVEQLDRDGLI